MWIIAFIMDRILIPKITLGNDQSLVIYVLLLLFLVRVVLKNQRNKEPYAIESTFIVWLFALLGLALFNNPFTTILLTHSTSILYAMFVGMIFITSFIFKQPFTLAYLENEINSSDSEALLFKQVGSELSYLWALLFTLSFIFAQLPGLFFHLILPTILMIGMFKRGNRAFVRFRIKQISMKKEVLS